MQVYPGEINYHIVSINPTSHEFIYQTSQLGIDLGRLKSNVEQIEKTLTVYFDRSTRMLNMKSQYFLLYILFIYGLLIGSNLYQYNIMILYLCVKY